MIRSSKQYWRNGMAVITWCMKPVLAGLLLGVIAINSTNVIPVQAIQAGQRPLSDFINAQAAAAAAHCAQFGTPPPGFVPVGDGPIIGPKQ